MAATKLFFAGSGGQGVLTMGQMLTYAAMYADMNATWLPSYGPEMRGGTANCTVVVSDHPIACPLINEADLLVVMNLPSLRKFESMVVPGGLLIVNSSLVPEKTQREDIRVVEIPADEQARGLGNAKAANIVMLGAILRETGVVRPDTIRAQMKKMFSGRKEKFLPLNNAAFDLYFER